MSLVQAAQLPLQATDRAAAFTLLRMLLTLRQGGSVCLDYSGVQHHMCVLEFRMGVHRCDADAQVSSMLLRTTVQRRASDAPYQGAWELSTWSLDALLHTASEMSEAEMAALHPYSAQAAEIAQDPVIHGVIGLMQTGTACIAGEHLYLAQGRPDSEGTDSALTIRILSANTTDPSPFGSNGYEIQDIMRCRR